METIKEFEAATGSQICEGYGLSETTPVVTINPFGGKTKVGSIGLPVPDTEIKIVDLDTGKKEMKVGEPGELIIKGPQVTQGYYKKPEETKAAIKDGWLFTGDIGTMDEEGYFYIVDRKKDMIIAGGYNIYPRDIDEVLYEHPKVAEGCAIGVPDPYRGETVKVFVVLKEGQTRHGGGDHQVLQGKTGRLQGAQARRVRPDPSQKRRWQDPEEGTPPDGARQDEEIVSTLFVA